MSIRSENHCAAAGDGEGGVGISTTHFSSPKGGLSDTGTMGGFRHLSVIAQDTARLYLVFGIIQIKIHVILHLVFLMVMVKLLWFQVSPTFNPRNIIIGLLVVIL